MDRAASGAGAGRKAILGGKNAVVLAPTAGGKTEASIFPILSALTTHPVEGVGALYVAPIKALLNNQEERFGHYAEMVGLRRFVWHGDATGAAKAKFLKEPCELLLITPESLEVMLLSPRVPVARLFAELRFAVIDEVHALAGTDRGTHLMSVLERIGRHSSHDFQRIGLSATVGNPQAISAWLQGSSKREACVVDPPKVKSARALSIVQRNSVNELAREAARAAGGKKSLFFCQSRALAETVAESMQGPASTSSCTTARCPRASARRPRTGSTTGRTPASWRPRRSSSASTWETSTSSSRRMRRAPEFVPRHPRSWQPVQSSSAGPSLREPLPHAIRDPNSIWTSVAEPNLVFSST